MSFVRAGRPLQHNKGKKALRPKKAAQRKEWVVSVTVTYLWDSGGFKVLTSLCVSLSIQARVI